MYTFVPGEQAKANELNSNFNEIMDILGPLSTPDRVRTTSEFTMGARQNTLFTGSHDTGPSSLRFFQIGYNADWEFSNGKWRFSRFVSGMGGSAIRLGEGNIEFMVTNKTTENFNTAMESAMRIVDNAADNYVFLNKSYHFQIVDEPADSIGDYRLTYVPLNNPTAIYDGQSVNAGVEVKRGTNYGASQYAKAITIQGWGRASGAAAATLRVYQERDQRSYRRGVTMYCDLGARGNISGFVALGEGAYEDRFVVDRSSGFQEVSLYVVGYWI